MKHKSDFQRYHSAIVTGYGHKVAEEPCSDCGSLLVSARTGKCVSCAKRAASVDTGGELSKRLMIDKRLDEIRTQRKIEQDYTTYAI